MRRMFFLMSFGIGAAMLGATQSHAQSVTCADHDVITHRLAAHFGEYHHASYLRNDNAEVTVFTSDATGSWTATLTMPGGLTCLVAAGRAFDPMALPSDWAIAGRRI